MKQRKETSQRKLPYSRPTLVEYGSVASLTQKKTGGSDGAQSQKYN